MNDSVRRVLLIMPLFLVFACLTRAQPAVTVETGPEVVTGEYQFTEGPYWHPDGFLLFSDIPANTVYQWMPGMNKAEVYLKPSGHSNGITADGEGNLILAQHDGMVSRVSADKKMTTLVSSYKGKRLNSPNDVAVHSSGAVYFTDPPFGVSEEDRELDFSGVFRLGPDGSLTLLYDGFSRPNGIVFSPDEKTLYVNDSNTGKILAFEVMGDGSVGDPVEFASVGERGQGGAADGMVVDSKGNLYSTGPGPALHVFSPEGDKILQVDFDEQVTNAGWGGENSRVLYITGADNVYRLMMSVDGLQQ